MSTSPIHSPRYRAGFASQAVRLVCLTVLALGITALCPAQAAVNDVFPGDYTTLPAGFTTVTGYGYTRRADGLYRRGVKQLDASLDAQIAALRISHFTKVGGWSFSPMMVLAWASIDPSSAAAAVVGPNARGMADLRLGGTLWLLEDWKTQEFLGITGTVILPTGSYDAARLLNIGENRSTYVISGGWITALGARTTLQINPEIAFYSDNERYLGANRLSQATSYALTGTVRFEVASRTHMFGSAQINRGGATSVNGVAQNNPASYTKLSVGASYLLASRQQWMLRYSRDVQIENGFKTAGELTLRYLIFF